MGKMIVSWKTARKVLSSIAWRGAILSLWPPILVGVLIGVLGAHNITDIVHPSLIVFFYILWIAYLYWCWLAAVKAVLEKYGFQLGENSQERSVSSTQKAAPVESHRKWVGVGMLYNLNGWRRLWVLLTILWLVPVGFFAYQQWPHRYSAHVAGCLFPDELFSVTAPGIVNDELVNWRRELLPNLVPDDDQLITTPRRKPISALTYDEFSGKIPGWNGDPLGRPGWAKAPLVEAYCKTLKERLERSGRAVQLRDASTNAMQKPRIEWLALVFAAWIGPAVGVYLLGLAIVWVASGFRRRS